MSTSETKPRYGSLPKGASIQHSVGREEATRTAAEFWNGGPGRGWPATKPEADATKRGGSSAPHLVLPEGLGEAILAGPKASTGLRAALNKNLLADAVTADGRSKRPAMGMPRSGRYALGRRLSDAERAYAVREPEGKPTPEEREAAYQAAKPHLERAAEGLNLNGTPKDQALALRDAVDPSIQTHVGRFLRERRTGVAAEQWASEQPGRTVEGYYRRKVCVDEAQAPQKASYKGLRNIVKPFGEPAPRPYVEFDSSSADAQAAAREAAKAPLYVG